MKGKKACILICIAAGICLAAGCAKKHDEDVSVRTDWGMFEWTEEQIEHPEEMAAFAEAVSYTHLILERMYLTENDVPGYPSSTSVVRIFYNKTAFDNAGAKVPETWEEFMDACQKLKDSGITPFGFPNATIADLSWLWFNNSISGQLDSGLVDELDVSGNGYVELQEIAKGMEEGKIDFTKPELIKGFELMKDFSQYWTSDYNGLDQKTAIQMFERGEVAMVQAMSINLADIEAVVGDSFEYGVMPIPVITKDTYETAMGKSVILGGQPDIIFAINKNLENDDAKLKAAIDFSQYMSSDVYKRQSHNSSCLSMSHYFRTTVMVIALEEVQKTL